MTTAQQQAFDLLGAGIPFAKKPEPKKEENIKEASVRIVGDFPPDLLSTFDASMTTVSLRRGKKRTETLKPFIQEQLSKLSLRCPTKIQQACIPMLCARRDVFAVSPTGSGKTYAYLIPILTMATRIASSTKPYVRSLVLSPTRELAAQIHREAKKLCPPSTLRISLCAKGGDRLDHVPHDLLVATPNALLSAIKAKAVILSKLSFLVLDEADKLFSTSFLPQLDQILSLRPPKVCTSLFSATLPGRVERMASNVLIDPFSVYVGAQNAAAKSVEQEMVYAGSERGKLVALCQWLHKGMEQPVLIFVSTKERALDLYTHLSKEFVSVGKLLSSCTPKERRETMLQFRAGRCWMLITTDVLGRGIDCIVNTVVNYDMPQSGEVYIHRVGRTGRAGKKGFALNLYTDEDAPFIRLIANIMKNTGGTSALHVPDWIMNLAPTLNKEQRKKWRRTDLKRAEINSEAPRPSKKKKTANGRSRKG